jgi:predicted transcriptional regulator
MTATTLRLPDDLAARLSESAASRRISVNALLVQLVAEWLQSPPPPARGAYATSEERKQAHRIKARESARRRRSTEV